MLIKKLKTCKFSVPNNIVPKASVSFLYYSDKRDIMNKKAEIMGIKQENPSHTWWGLVPAQNVTFNFKANS